ncbi:MAG TPA: hypothetical protein VGR96_09430 [Acidobacteriaceae bacterium]|nr:hypothetical protein [Acidobacteriaceae bacterium]
MRRVAPLIVALACTFSAAASFAECPTPMAVRQEYKFSQEILVGTVESARPVPQTWDTLDGTNYLVHIDQKVKGKQSGEITIFDEHSADGFKLQTGKQYLLFLSNNYQHWIVNKCGNSGELDQVGPVIKQMAHLLGND